MKPEKQPAVHANANLRPRSMVPPALANATRETALEDLRLPLLVLRYREAMRARGLASSSMKTWCAWLMSFARFAGSGEAAAADLRDFHADSLKSWLLALAAKGLRPRTRRSAIAALRSFGDWLLREDLLPSDPAASLQPPKLDAARRELCTDEEVRALLVACDRLPNLRRSALAKCVIQIMACAALRRGELLALHCGDINQADQSITVRSGKGSKARTIFPHEDCLASVRVWMRERGVCKHDYLLDFDHARRLGDAGLRTLLEEIKTIAGYRGARNLLPHSIRHNAATRLMRNGVDIESIRVFLGHSDLQTTAVYLHTSEQRLRGLAAHSGLENGTKTEAAAAHMDNTLSTLGTPSDVRRARRARIEREPARGSAGGVVWRRVR